MPSHDWPVMRSARVSRAAALEVGRLQPRWACANAVPLVARQLGAMGPRCIEPSLLLGGDATFA